MPVKPVPPNTNSGRAVKAEPLAFDPLSIGSTGLKQSGGFIQEEFLKELRGQAGMRKFREMADNSYVIGAMLFGITTLIRGVEWTIQAADDSAEAEAAKVFVEEVLADMRTSFDDVLSEICTMFVYGFAPMEIIWKRRTEEPDEIGMPGSKFTDGKIGIKAISLRSQETVFQWEILEADGTILGLWQQPWNGTQVFIPSAKMLLFRTDAIKNNPQGRSILRNAYRSWYFATKIEEIEAIGVERDLAGLPMVRIPSQFMRPDSDPADKLVFQAYQNMVKNVRRDQTEGIVLPSDRDPSGNYHFDFTLVSTGGSRTFDTNKVLSRHDRGMATAVLADFIFLGQQAVGSFALSSDKTALFAQAVQSFLDHSIAQNINENLFPRLFHLNGIDPKLAPKAVPGQIEEASLAEVTDFITKLTGAGAMFFPDRDLENDLRKKAGLPPAPEEGDDMRTPGMDNANGQDGEDPEDTGEDDTGGDE